jgi:hypothetical protein
MRTHRHGIGTCYGMSTYQSSNSRDKLLIVQSKRIDGSLTEAFCLHFLLEGFHSCISIARLICVRILKTTMCLQILLVAKMLCLRPQEIPEKSERRCNFDSSTTPS